MEVSDTTHTVMHDIPEGGPYTFVVTARSEIGLGPNSESSPVQVSMQYCNSCGRVLPDDHFLCPQCKNPSCTDCCSPLGTCLSCNPYRSPGAPGKVKAEIDRSDATVSWSKPADDGGKPILEYTVGIQELPGKHVSVKDGTSTAIADLPAGGPYTFTVAATNEIGMGPKTESLPLEVERTSCDRCKIVLDDDPVVCEGCGGGFGPECIATPGLCIDCHEKALAGSPGEVIASLTPNNVGASEVSWQPSDDQGGSPVTEYVVRCVEDSSITVSVDASSKYCPSCGREGQSGLQYCTVCGTKYPSTLDKEQRYTAAVRLKAIGGSYSFTVSAVNSAGEGTPSSPSNAIQFIPQKLLPSVAILALGEIRTIAGNGKGGDSGDGGLATSARLNEPYDVAVDELGNIYIADSGNNKIRRISVNTGLIKTVVGTGTSGFSGDGGPAVDAQLDRPRGIDFDSLGNLYIADRGNNRVRKVDFRSHEIGTIAGNGTSGYVGDGMSAHLAELHDPESVSVDQTTGRIYIAGWHGIGTGAITKKIRVVDETGTIHTFAGSDKGRNPQDGVSATNVTFSTIDDLVIAVDSAGNVFIGEQNGKRLYTVSCETGSITTIAGDGSDGDGEEAGPAIEVPIAPQGLASYGRGSTVFINDGGSVFLGHKRIRKLDMESGITTTVAGYGKNGFGGDGGPAISAKFKKPRGLAVDNYGNLYIADSGNNRIRVVRRP